MRPFPQFQQTAPLHQPHQCLQAAVGDQAWVVTRHGHRTRRHGRTHPGDAPPNWSSGSLDNYRSFSSEGIYAFISEHWTDYRPVDQGSIVSSFNWTAVTAIPRSIWCGRGAELRRPRGDQPCTRRSQDRQHPSIPGSNWISLWPPNIMQEQTAHEATWQICIREDQDHCLHYGIHNNGQEVALLAAWPIFLRH